jgi:hypothetical protein
MKDMPKIFRFATNLQPGLKDDPGPDMQVREFVLANEWFALRDEALILKRKADMFDAMTPTLVQLGMLT